VTFEELKSGLQRRYNRAVWLALLREMFSDVTIYAHSSPVSTNDREERGVRSFEHLGNVTLHDGKVLAILEGVVADRIQLRRNRVNLRRWAAQYIDQHTHHGVLAVFHGNEGDYRFSFISKESGFDDDGRPVRWETQPKRYTYLLGPGETCATPARRFRILAEKRGRAGIADIVDAFSVEKLTKEFFDRYKERYDSFVAHLLSGDLPRRVFGIPSMGDMEEQEKANKPVRDFVKRLLGRLVFLHYLQKKGWLGCPAGDAGWRNGDRDFLRNLFHACPDKEKFHSARLVPLFFAALNSSNRPGDIFPLTNSRVPYLNGGLFEKERVPYSHDALPVDRIDFPGALFADLLEFFAQYNFTIDEDDPDDREVGIDPEMLGLIFENLLEDNRDKGAYYTPKSVVQHMCQESLLRYLRQRFGDRDELVRLVRDKDDDLRPGRDSWLRQNAKDIEVHLDCVKICDPAIGSGAFPIGLLQEIYWIKMTLDWTLDPAETKLKIIENSIHGVDLDAGAVEIARLRFWLALIVDEETPRPLPNLDYRIMQGDSLRESFEGISLERIHEPEDRVVSLDPRAQGTFGFADAQPALAAREKAAQIFDLMRRYFGENDPARKQEFHREIDRAVLDHIEYNLRVEGERVTSILERHKADFAEKSRRLRKTYIPPKKIAGEVAALKARSREIGRSKAALQSLEEKPERPYFLWHLYFRDVFERGGFDIVIANPPYVSVEKFARQPVQDDWKARYPETYAARGDIYCFFYQRGIELLRDGGTLCFISSNKFMRAGYGEGLRKLLSRQTLDALIDFCELPVFAAATDPAIVLLGKSAPPEGHMLCAAVVKEPAEIERLVPALERRGVSIPQADLRADGWSVEGGEGRSILEKLRSAGKPLAEYVGGTMYRGILTGLNDAFVIDRETRDRLIAEDPRSSKLIRKWIRGKDILRWKGKFAEQYLIQIESSENISHPWSGKPEREAEAEFLKAFPAVHAWLAKSRRALVERTDQGTYFWELRSCAYWEAFDRPKIVFNETSKELHAYVDRERYAINKTGFIILADEPEYVLAVLNSSALDYLYRSEFPAWGDPWRDGRVQFRGDRMATVPIPAADAAQKEELASLARKAARAAGSELAEIEREIDRAVYRLFDLTPDEIALIERSIPRHGASGGRDHKTALFTVVLPTLKEGASFFSIGAVRRALNEAEIELSDDLLREYMSEAMASGIVSDAGRGWYSRHEKPVSLDPKPVSKLVRAVEKAFPLFDFCCWSTVQFNPFAQHLIANPLLLLYAESDALESVAERLRESGWDAWPNPKQDEATRHVRPGTKTVVLRPAIRKQPEAVGHYAPIEKALVDLKVEAKLLRLMDESEFQRILDSSLQNGIIQIPVISSYFERREQKWQSPELTH